MAISDNTGCPSAIGFSHAMVARILSLEVLDEVPKEVIILCLSVGDVFGRTNSDTLCPEYRFAKKRDKNIIGSVYLDETDNFAFIAFVGSVIGILVWSEIHKRKKIAIAKRPVENV